MATIEKVFAYITRGRELLVFEHVDFPEAGVQVPAGTLGADEVAAKGVLREAREETGLVVLELVGFLGECEIEMLDRPEIHRRRFYHLRCLEETPDRWRHDETDPSNQPGARIRFELYWVALPSGLPSLDRGHDAFLPTLLERLDQA